MAKEKDSKKAVKSDVNLGTLLKEYREAAGYSLTQMAEALCLPDETLQHLENEEFKTLPEPPYVRGYLRNYAKLAEKDPARLISLYESLRGADPSELDYHFKSKPTILTDSKRKISPVMGQLLLLSLLLALLAGISMIPAVNKWITNTWNSFSEQTQQQANSNNQDLIGTMPVPTPLAIEENKADKATDANKASSENATASQAQATSSQTPQTADNKTSKAADTNQAATNTDQASSAAQGSTQGTTENNTASDTIHIKLVFNKEVWMKIKDGNNKTVFEALNPAGGSKDLTLKKPLHFRVGNAQGLSLFVDDESVDISSYIKGSVAKFTLE